MKIDRTQISSFTSFEDADDADRSERWSMSPKARLELLENLRRYKYPNGKSAPRLQRVFISTKRTSS